MTRDARLSKEDKVVFYVRPGEHNILYGRPGVVLSVHGDKLKVRCTEIGTIFEGNIVIVQRANLKTAAQYKRIEARRLAEIRRLQARGVKV